MAELQDYSTTAGSNNSASPAGWPENMAPSGVNDSDRELAARIARERDDTQGVTATGGSANAYTFAATRDTAAAYTGECITFRANHTNTGATTINITPSGGSARGTVAIQYNGAALVGNEIVSGGVYTVVYTGTAYQLMNASFRGSGGESTNPLQPAFKATAASQPNVTGDGTDYAVTFTTENYDQGGDFASSTFTFPVAGVYLIVVGLDTFGLLSSHTDGRATIICTGKTYTYSFGPYGGADALNGQNFKTFSVLHKAAASDTASVALKISNGTKVVDISTDSYFCGILIA